jgi:hypothetical protein
MPTSAVALGASRHFSGKATTRPDGLLPHCRPTVTVNAGVHERTPHPFLIHSQASKSGGFLVPKIKELKWPDLSSCMARSPGHGSGVR